MAGTLFVVATPIGNLEDITLRALRTLREVDLIAAEDTRRTAKLLAHYEIRKPVVSLHAHNEFREAPRLVARIGAGISIALVSDAGTPGISDPGELLVRLTREAELRVTPIPGPSSIAAALSVSGLPAAEFVFMGFPPRAGRERADWLERLNKETRTVVAFESPHRLNKTLSEIQMLAIRPIQIHRELTKIHESFVISPNYQTAVPPDPVGEFVLVIHPAGSTADSLELSDTIRKAVHMFGCMTTNCGFAETEAAALVAKALEVKESDVRKAAKKDRIARKRRAEGLS